VTIETSVMSSSFPPGWEKHDPVEWELPSWSISIGSWWGKWNWFPWQIDSSR